MKKKIFLIFGALSSIVIPFLLLMSILTATISVQTAEASDECSSMQDQGSNNGSDISSDTDTAGREKKIFEFVTQKEGFSGAGGAGILARSNIETGGTFDPKITNPSGGVAGIFQWSGWDNTINGDRIHSEGSIKGNDETTLTLANELKLFSYELKNSYSKIKTLVGKASDPVQAYKDFSAIYELGGNYNDGQMNLEQGGALATKYFLKYDGADIPSTIADGASDGADENYDNDQNEANSGCEVGPGEGEQVDGEIPRGTPYDKLTSAQKKAVGKRASFSSYPNGPFGHQCTWYAYHRTVELGFNYAKGEAQGNGMEFGQSDANMQVVKGKPKAHSAVDYLPGQNGAGAGYGHVGVVEYVNPDGSIITSESNVLEGHIGLDQATANQPYETYMSVSAADAKKLTYVYPKGEK